VRNLISVGSNANANVMSNKYAHEHPEFAEIRVTRAVTEDGRHRLCLELSRRVVYDRATNFLLPEAVVEEFKRGLLHTLLETAATPTQWLKLKHLDWATYQRLGQPGTPNWSGKLITVQQMEGVLKSVQGKAARQMIADQPLKKTLADDATSRQAKVLASEMAEMAKVKEARKYKPDALPPAADNDNGEIMSSGEAAVELGITTQTLRRWIDVGRPIVGRKRKRKDELKVKTIGGRYVFEAASVRALAKQLAGWS